MQLAGSEHLKSKPPALVYIIRIFPDFFAFLSVLYSYYIPTPSGQQVPLLFQDPTFPRSYISKIPHPTDSCAFDPVPRWFSIAYSICRRLPRITADCHCSNCRFVWALHPPLHRLRNSRPLNQLLRPIHQLRSPLFPASDTPTPQPPCVRPTHRLRNLPVVNTNTEDA